MNDYEDCPVMVKNQIIHRDACAVEVEAMVDGEVYFAVGVARRHPQDSFDEKVGIKYAYSRAFESLANQLRRQADGAVKHAEDMRIAKERLAQQQNQLRIKNKPQRVQETLEKLEEQRYKPWYLEFLDENESWSLWR